MAKIIRYNDLELEEFKVILEKQLGEAKAELFDKNNIENLSVNENGLLIQRQEKFIQNLENALIRIENKTYGICRVTGKLIPRERLIQVPHATLYIETKFNGSGPISANYETTSIMKTQPKLEHIKISEVTTRDQVRTIFDEDSQDELTASVLEKGVLQPIGVRKIKDKLVIVYGERRYRAAKAVNTAHKDRNTIPAVVFENMSDEEALELQIIENLQRKDVHPMEEGVAFKNLLAVKGFDILEISKRVTKSTAYVGARLKLVDLIPEFQKAFYKDRMILTTALKICKIASSDQKELWKEDFEGTERRIKVNSYTLNKYMNNLLNAPFDIKDATINKKVGACGTCPFNTASNTLLFPDEAGKSICTNSTCYREKCDISYKVNLIKSIEDPEVILVRDSYGSMEKEAKALADKGNRIYLSSDYTSVKKPEAIDRLEFEEGLEEGDYDDKAEMEERYSSALEDYEKDLKKYELDIASGKFVKAFIVEGNGKGEIKFVKLNKVSAASTSGKITAKGVQEKLKEGNATDADIKGEIERMQGAEVRKKELDEEKAWPQIYELLDENERFIENKLELSIHEKIALIFVLTDNIHYSFEIDEFLPKFGFKGDAYDDVEVLEWLLKNVKKHDELINNLSRLFFYSKISAVGKIADKGDKLALVEVIKQYDTKRYKAIDDIMVSERTKRDERLKLAVDKLKEKLKPVKVKKVAKK